MLNAGTASGGTLQPALQGSLNITTSGYLYIYVSNATPNWPVFFDNLNVLHLTGPLVEESHYYPFGLTMAGISDKALKTPYAGNKYRFQKQELQNKEFSDGSGLEMYEFKYRMDDPQTGRFWQVDPLADKYVYNSTYAFSEDKVTTYIELEGLEATPANGFWRAVENELHAAASAIDKNVTVGNKTTVETSMASKGNPMKSETTTATTTTTTNTNFDEVLGYIINNNSNSGNPAPLLKTETKTEASGGVKVDVKTPMGSGSASASVDDKGKVTVSGTASVKLSPSLSATTSGSTSSDGTSKVGVGVSATTNNTTVKGSVVLGKTVTIGFMEFDLGVEQKIGNTKVTNTSFIKIGPRN